MSSAFKHICLAMMSITLANHFISEEMAYPFGNKIDFTITIPESTSFPIEFRKPKWCD